jgi:hypothetical protein
MAQAAISPPTPHEIALALILVRVLPSLTGRGERSASVEDPEAWHNKHAKWVQKMLMMVMREVLNVRAGL